MMRPETKYQSTTTKGPSHPTSYESFLENKIISKVGFEKLG